MKLYLSPLDARSINFSDFFFKQLSRALEIEGKTLNLQIWDTAGSERFRSIVPSYYRGAHAVFVVFDITDKNSFINAENIWWKQAVRQTEEQSQLALIFLIGNKCDLEDQRVVSVEEAEAMVKKNGLVRYFEVSARTAHNAEEAFNEVVKILYKTTMELSPDQMLKPSALI